MFAAPYTLIITQSSACAICSIYSEICLRDSLHSALKIMQVLKLNIDKVEVISDIFQICTYGVSILSRVTIRKFLLHMGGMARGRL